MTPLRVEARLLGAICLPNGPLALDALLTWVEAQRRELPPPASAGDCTDLPIPLAQDRGVWLASFGTYELEESERDWTNRRFPLPEAQDLGGAKLKRVMLSAGPSKSYRLPRERMHLVDDRVTWWAVGDAGAVRGMLAEASYLGKRRGVGLGKVRQWSVEPCERWEGFPVLMDGAPLRSLPLDWPGVSPESERAYAVLRPPYWDNAKRVEAYVPRAVT